MVPVLLYCLPEDPKSTLYFSNDVPNRRLRADLEVKEANTQLR
jgi:hypothetical protein